MPREGTETFTTAKATVYDIDLEIRCPERGRKLSSELPVIAATKFGNKMPREGTETLEYHFHQYKLPLYIWK